MKIVTDQSLMSVRKGIIVHGVNGQGKMNKGLAKQIRQAYPVVYEDYMNRQATHGLLLGSIIVSEITPDLIVISGVSQKYYGNDPNVTYASLGAIKKIFRLVTNYNLKYRQGRLEIHYPRIGGQLGNLPWPQTQREIEAEFSDQLTYVLHDYQQDSVP